MGKSRNRSQGCVKVKFLPKWLSEHVSPFCAICALHWLGLKQLGGFAPSEMRTQLERWAENSGDPSLKCGSNRRAAWFCSEWQSWQTHHSTANRESALWCSLIILSVTGHREEERKEGREGQSMKESYCNDIVGGCRWVEDCMRGTLRRLEGNGMWWMGERQTWWWNKCWLVRV